jgi:transcriptional regulator with XRE-family HTH domain
VQHGGMELAHPLRKYRAKARKTLTEAAGALDISPAQLSRIETGKQLPQPEVILRIAAWTKNTVTANDLLGLKRGRTAA